MQFTEGEKHFNKRIEKIMRLKKLKLNTILRTY